MLKVSKVDSQILRCLLEDGRESFADIARRCNVTKNRVCRHYAALKKKGIITGATTLVNYGKLGYEGVAILLLNVQNQNLDTVVNYVDNLNDVYACRQYNSMYNVKAVTFLKELSELDQVKQTIRRHLSTIGLKTYLLTGVHNIPENLNFLRAENLEGQADFSSQESSKCMNGRIDGLDKEIISKHTQMCAFHLEDCFEVGTSTDTIIKRYYKLRKNNIIKTQSKLTLTV
jgi:DNA-binding Lrp family transcriptional regulator